MLLSSGFVWRHRTFEDFRAECPAGDPVLQRLVYDRLDEALDWLESLGAPVLERDTGNPRTVGRRFDTFGLTEALGRTAGDVRLHGRPPENHDGPLVLARRFPAALAERMRLILRANPWSTGDGLWLARRRGGATAGDLDEFYGRNLRRRPRASGEEGLPAALTALRPLRVSSTSRARRSAPRRRRGRRPDLVRPPPARPWGRPPGTPSTGARCASASATKPSGHGRRGRGCGGRRATRGHGRRARPRAAGLREAL